MDKIMVLGDFNPKIMQLKHFRNEKQIRLICTFTAAHNFVDETRKTIRNQIDHILIIIEGQAQTTTWYWQKLNKK